MTDAGCRGAGNSFKVALGKFDCIVIDYVNRKYSTYLEAICALQRHNIILKNSISVVMGEGGLRKRNCIQLLHSAYNLRFGGGGGGVEYEEFTSL